MDHRFRNRGPRDLGKLGADVCFRMRPDLRVQTDDQKKALANHCLHFQEHLGGNFADRLQVVCDEDAARDFVLEGSETLHLLPIQVGEGGDKQ